MPKREPETTTDPSITVRVPAEWLARADELVLRVRHVEEVRRYGKPTLSMIARLAMLRGLDALEQEYPETPAKRARRG